MGLNEGSGQGHLGFAPDPSLSDGLKTSYRTLSFWACARQIPLCRKSLLYPILLLLLLLLQLGVPLLRVLMGGRHKSVGGHPGKIISMPISPNGNNNSEHYL